MKKILIGLFVLCSYPAFSSERIRPDLLYSFKESFANRIDSAQCQREEQIGHFSLKGYGHHMHANPEGNLFDFSDLIRDAARGERDSRTKTTTFYTVTNYTATRSQTIVTKLVTAPSHEVASYEITEYFNVNINKGTKDNPIIVKETWSNGTRYSCQ